MPSAQVIGLQLADIAIDNYNIVNDACILGIIFMQSSVSSKPGVMAGTLAIKLIPFDTASVRDIFFAKYDFIKAS